MEYRFLLISIVVSMSLVNSLKVTCQCSPGNYFNMSYLGLVGGTPQYKLCSHLWLLPTFLQLNS